MATGRASLATSRLTSSKITQVQDKALDIIQSGNTTEGLRYLIERYQTILIGFSPAYILLTIFLVLCLIIGVLLVVGFGLSHSLMGGYWDEGYAKAIIKTIFKTVCGVWLIEGLIMGLIRLEEKARFWWAFVPLAGFVACIVVAMTVEFTATTSNSTDTS